MESRRGDIIYSVDMAWDTSIASERVDKPNRSENVSAYLSRASVKDAPTNEM
jgi:hypothetical protein